MFLNVFTLNLHPLFPGHCGRLAQDQVLFDFATLTTGLQQSINALTDALGQPQPGKLKHPGHTDQQTGDEYQA